MVRMREYKPGAMKAMRGLPLSSVALLRYSPDLARRYGLPEMLLSDIGVISRDTPGVRRDTRGIRAACGGWRLAAGG
jgi:hypothetical protein